MKRRTVTGPACIFLFILALCLVGNVTGQEMIVNGGFADTTGWTIYNLDSANPSEAQFGVDDDDRPALGVGPYLYLNGVSSDYTNILVWQKLNLVAGTTYEFHGAFKDLTFGQLNQFWSEIYISTQAPVDGVDYTPIGTTSSDRFLAFNTWTPCGAGVDGSYEADGCSNPKTNLYTPEGEPGTPVEIYFALKTGVWCGGTEYSFMVAVDEFTLKPVGGTAVENDYQANIEQYELFQNYPNPFNPTTTIHFAVPGTESVSLAVYDLTGRKIRTLVNETFNAGNHAISWNGCNDAGQNVTSGIYFYKLQAGNYSMMRKMTLLK